MPYLVVAVVFVGALCAVNLLLTLAVIRRLREHSAQLANGRSTRPPLVASGTALPEFTASASDGTTVSQDFFTGPTLVGMFSTTCAACHERLPEFTAWAGQLGPGRALAVVTGDPEDAGVFTAALAPVAPVVVEPPDGPLARAFQVSFFPTFYLVDDRAVITAAADAPDRLPLAART
ncbi:MULTISPECIES: TlpA family protein disulfide reductase [Streptosporangium]|uniref:Thiol-disulfide isomerase/thioredoxin n=1 Tax=Streptosporangium brasiliense TaxID=47480 RepID=A0ABT9R3B6_9ACTN|nr:redoxin domain-containing protein [Streptosporangium brasiliense]MDP9863716.1 thiol-disulfide isomerase/thioredoxin [Streptosporangium brasiliense]